MRPLESVQCCNFHCFSLLCSVVLTLGMWIRLVLFFFLMSHWFYQFSKQADLKCQWVVFEMCVTLLAVTASDLDIVATLLAIRASCDSKLPFSACFDLRNVLLVVFFPLLLDSMITIYGFFFLTLAIIWSFSCLWDFLLTHMYLWLIGLCFL